MQPPYTPFVIEPRKRLKKENVFFLWPIRKRFIRVTVATKLNSFPDLQRAFRLGFLLTTLSEGEGVMGSRLYTSINIFPFKKHLAKTLP